MADAATANSGSDDASTAQQFRDRLSKLSPDEVIELLKRRLASLGEAETVKALTEFQAGRIMEQIAEHPTSIRRLRGQLNALLGKPPSSLLDEELADWHRVRHRGPRGAAPSVVTDRSLFSVVTAIAQKFTEMLPPPECLTSDRPVSLPAKEARHVTPALCVFESVEGRYSLSYARNLPVVFADHLIGRPVVRLVSATGDDSIAAIGGPSSFPSPDEYHPLAFLIHDRHVAKNYCHWMLDWLPRLLILRDCAPEAKLFLLDDLPKFYGETLNLIGFPPDDVINLTEKGEGSIGGFRKFYALSSSREDYSHALQAGTAWMASLLKQVFDSGATESRRNLLIGRRSSRRLIFSPETLSLLSRHGFQTVYLEDETVRDQIRLFSEAKAIIAAHGAGLANLAFCRSGTRVLEIFPEGMSTPAYWNTARAAGVEYACAVGEARAQPGKGNPRNLDLQVPPQVVSGWISAAARC